MIDRWRRASTGMQVGFTLVELMVTLAILAILTMLAVPSMTDLIRDARLSAQADLLINTLNMARLEAVKRRTNVTVCPAANPDSDAACSANVGDWANGMMVWDGAAVIQRVQGKRELVVSNAPVAVVFSGTIGSATAAATFNLCVAGRREQQVNVALSGHVSKQVNATLCV